MQPDRFSSQEMLQFARYLAVGGSASVLVLALYYVATLSLRVEPKIAVTLANAPGFALTYAANRAWTFRSKAGARSFLRYAAGYLASYLIQLASLLVGVDVIGWRHEWVVLFGVSVATLFFFPLQRFWVFPTAVSAPG